MKSLNRKATAALLFAALMTTAACSNSDGGGDGDEFPSKPIEMIVPYAPGGVTDQVARVIATTAAKHLDQPIRVITVPGGGSVDGTRQVVEAEPDGHTINFGGSGSVLSAPSLRDVGFTYEDLVPVALTSWSNMTFNVAANSEHKTLDDLVQAAKAAPGELSYSTAGVGGTGHVLATFFEEEFGVEFSHVPYDGASEADLAVMGGHVDFSVTGVGSTIGPIKEGRLRSLGVTSAERDPLLPDTPTFSEAGYDMEFIVWRGLFLPKDTPSEVVDVWTDVVEKMNDDEEYQTLMEAIEPTFLIPSEEAQQRIADEAESFAPVYERLRSEIE
jgi:tripartite-type tricarboxylate transporter receptor subunit TctC